MLFGTRISRSKLLAVLLLLSLHTVAITNVVADQGIGAERGPTVAELKREGDTFVRAGKYADAGRSYSQALGKHGRFHVGFLAERFPCRAGSPIIQPSIPPSDNPSSTGQTQPSALIILQAPGAEARLHPGSFAEGKDFVEGGKLRGRQGGGSGVPERDEREGWR